VHLWEGQIWQKVIRKEGDILRTAEHANTPGPGNREKVAKNGDEMNKGKTRFKNQCDILEV
jgi:hypothetical protein